MKGKTITIISGVSVILLSSCAAMFNGMVLPNQCKKCSVINNLTGDTLDVYEGCGSENTRLEESAKVSAFDLIKSTGNCNIDVYCTTWKKDPEE